MSTPHAHAVCIYVIRAHSRGGNGGLRTSETHPGRTRRAPRAFGNRPCKTSLDLPGRTCFERVRRLVFGRVACLLYYIRVPMYSTSARIHARCTWKGVCDPWREGTSVRCSAASLGRKCVLLERCFCRTASHCTCLRITRVSTGVVIARVSIRSRYSSVAIVITLRTRFGPDTARATRVQACTGQGRM